MRRVLLVAFAMLATANLGLAQNAAIGTWSGETQGRGGAQTVTVAIAQGEEGLMGTWTQNEQESPLSEITVEGNAVSFQRAVAGRGGAGQETLVTYTGEIEDNQLTLTQAAGRGGGGGGGAPGAGGGAPGAGGGGGGGRGGRGGGGPIVLTRQ